MPADTTHVIVGAGHAGGRAAEAMRALEFAGNIILIGEEAHPPYERPALSKELLQGRHEAFTPVRPHHYYDENDIECRFGTRATALDPAAKTVTLDSGDAAPYDKLLLTTGASVRRLDLPGNDLDNVIYLRTLDDSRLLDERLADGPTVVVIGGGFIGLEVAASARLRGCNVTVLEIADRLMGRAVIPEISEAFLRLHRGQGVDVRLNDGVAALEGDGRVERVVTTTGATLPADLVVVGIGIVPNDGIAAEAGLAVDNGIVVDEFCRTSAPDIFAAGDVTSHFNAYHGRHLRLESWQNAQNQAIAAARVMCGEETPYAEVPWMWTDQFDANLQVAGVPEQWDMVVFRGDPQADDFIAFQIADNAVVGALSLNRPRDMRFARRLIGSEKPLDLAALTDETVKLRDLAR